MGAWRSADRGSPRRGSRLPSVPRPGSAASLVQMLNSSRLFQGLCIAGMKLVSVALMFLGSLAFLGTDAAQLDGASETLKK